MHRIKYFDTNHRQTATDCPSQNVVTISSSKLEFASRARREQYTAYSNSKHLKMTNKHLKSAVVIMNMKNTIRPIS